LKFRPVRTASPPRPLTSNSDSLPKARNPAKSWTSRTCCCPGPRRACPRCSRGSGAAPTATTGAGAVEAHSRRFHWPPAPAHAAHPSRTRQCATARTARAAPRRRWCRQPSSLSRGWRRSACTRPPSHAAWPAWCSGTESAPRGRHDCSAPTPPPPPLLPPTFGGAPENGLLSPTNTRLLLHSRRAPPSAAHIVKMATRQAISRTGQARDFHDAAIDDSAPLSRCHGIESSSFEAGRTIVFCAPTRAHSASPALPLAL
jgi:hypothetical protein